MLIDILMLVIGAILGFGGTWASGYVKEFFDERELKKKVVRKAASDILLFVNEGMHTGFRHKAKSIEFISLRANEIEAIDEDTGKKLRRFLNCWSQYRDFVKRGSAIEDEKFAIEFRSDAQSLGTELLDTAKKWASSGKV